MKAIKVDLYKEHRAEYVTPREPVFVSIGPAKYLTLVGQGSPKGEKFAAAISALYSVAFALKMAEKFAGHDYKVCHLEGQWWTDGGSDWQTTKPEDWHWRLLIRVPEFISEKELWVAIKTVVAKGKGGALVHEVKLETLEEGRCVQVLHIGPYSAEKPTLDKMNQLSASNGLHFRGPHHEIYLSDPRRVPETRLRTILRHPVQ
ncbi:MAG TPA: GyrI-like domain-containing protein [Terriglobales bacterium]|nr:GyrI-like domain-containing protein [Terriglobales bacterium]